MVPDGERLARRIGTGDAVVVGLAAMVGAGVFAAVGPAAAAAGSLLLVGLGLAGLVAYCNATSSAQLAARHPESGGTYVYARERLGQLWGFLAGWSFVVGKTASLAAMALTFGVYAWSPLARPLAVASVLALTAVNYRGVEKTARLARVLVAFVFAILAVVTAAALGGGTLEPANLRPVAPEGAAGVFEAAALLFFAFAGYARIATLGEEVRDPEVAIPRAIPLALGIVLVTYALVMGGALAAVGPEALASDDAPLAAVVEAGRWAPAAPLVRIGAAVASLGVMLSLLAGVSRTGLSMARRRELPGWLDAVHTRHRTPHRAEVVVGVAVALLVLVADLRGAIGFSSFAVLTYYGLTNASAWRLAPAERRWPRWLAGLGVTGCAALAFSLPAMSIIGGLLLLAAGVAAWLLRSERRSRGRQPD